MDKQLLTLRGLNFWLYATNAVLQPFLPLYFGSKGYTSSQIGFLMNVGPLVAIFAQPFWGYLSDRLHTVKRIILLLWALAIACSVGLFVSASYGLTLSFVLLMFFFLQPSMPLLDSITVRSVEKRGASYGSVRLFGSLGFTTVSLIGGTVLGLLGGIARIPYLYWATWIVPLLLLIPLRDEPAGGERMSLKTMGQIGRNKAFLWFLVLVLIISVPHRMNDVLLGLYMKQRGASDNMVGWAWALAAIVELPAFALLNRVMRRVHEHSLIGFAALLYSLRWLGYALADDAWTLLALQAGASVTFAVFWIAAVHYTARMLPGHLGATGQSLLAMVFLGLAGIIGGTVGGRLNDAFGGGSMYAFASVTALFAGAGFLATQFAARRRKGWRTAA
jgi:PPP family 3-phenylpropionic acid transporter